VCACVQCVCERESCETASERESVCVCIERVCVVCACGVCVCVCVCVCAMCVCFECPVGQLMRRSNTHNCLFVHVVQCVRQ